MWVSPRYLSDLRVTPFAHLVLISFFQFELGASQWVNCDIRTFEVELLGQFGVIMADPPWDIHMELPYGTMADDEMRALKVQVRRCTALY